MRRTLRITETELRNIITESVKKFINEEWQWLLQCS